MTPKPTDPPSQNEPHDANAGSPVAQAADAPHSQSQSARAAIEQAFLRCVHDPELKPADLARLVTAYANFMRASSAKGDRPRRASDAAPRPDDRHDPAAPNTTDRESEITFRNGKPTPRKLRGYHPDAPYGRRPDGAPYSADEFYDALRTALRINYGMNVDTLPKPPTDSCCPASPAADPLVNPEPDSPNTS